MKEVKELWRWILNALFNFLCTDSIEKSIFVHIPKTKKSKITKDQERRDDEFNRKAWIDYLNSLVSRRHALIKCAILLKEILYIDH